MTEQLDDTSTAHAPLLAASASPAAGPRSSHLLL